MLTSLNLWLYKFLMTFLEKSKLIFKKDNFHAHQVQVFGAHRVQILVPSVQLSKHT